MDRTIKFRAWDKGWKQIVYPDIIYHNINLGCNIHRAFKSSDGTHYFPIQENLTLMQFTGLYDCEGKEIYEGDVIEYDDYNWFEQKKVRKSSTVIYDDGMFVANEEESSPAIYCLENTKVLRNIYEHPHLLNNEQ